MGKMSSNSDDALFGPGRLWVESALLNAEPRIRHAMTTRRMARTAQERVETVQRLQAEAGWGVGRIALAEQVHGGENALIAEETLASWPARETRTFGGVDALVACVPDVTLAIFTADCVPILFADVEAGVIGAVHAGWRGTMASVLPTALELAIGMGAGTGRIRLWIGPAISGKAYEVSEELARRFEREFPNCAAAAVQARFVDLAEINRSQALGLGLRPENVSMTGLCTLANLDDFFSYRAEGAAAGRMASAIMLCPVPRPR
jgi:polyphenol oxidase